jgi:uncharacterized protein
MNDILLAFLTGLTTGGLSCLAVQGGLLAGSVAHEVEQTQVAGRGRMARPIVFFLAAKVIAYTVLGFLLGLLGSVFQLSMAMRAALQVAIGVFMVGTALRMFNVHPIFRYFALEPPRFVTRYIRRKARGEASALTPIFLGVLTVLIPCGVTQAMMALAIASGNPVVGATTLLAFTLGTTPVFFALAYLATRLGSRLEKGFITLVAAVVLVLGLLSIDTGLTLGGWPYSVTNLRMAMSMQRAEPTPPFAPRPLHLTPAPAVTAAAPVALLPVIVATPGQNSLSGMFGPVAPPSGPGVVNITVKNDGYFPQVSRAKADTPLRLALTTNETYSCARAFVIPSLRVQEVLPETGTVVVDIPPQPAGSKLFYSCSMGMYSGVILFEG